MLLFEEKENLVCKSKIFLVIPYLALPYSLQAFIQIIGVLNAFLWTLPRKGLNMYAISSIAAGLISLITGELGGCPTLIFYLLQSAAEIFSLFVCLFFFFLLH